MKENYSIDDVNSGNIVNVANHFLKSELSLREFAKKYCDFSHVTLREKFLCVLPGVKNELYVEVVNYLENRRSKSVINDAETRNRVLLVVDLFLNEDLYISEIASKLDTSEMTIYRDLTRRVMDMDIIPPLVKEEVKKRLEIHSHEVSHLKEMR